MAKNKDSRFGTIGVEKGFFSTDQLVEALGIQAKENIKDGTHRLLGQILLDMGYITEDQIDEILETINTLMILRVSGWR